MFWYGLILNTNVMAEGSVYNKFKVGIFLKEKCQYYSQYF